MCLSSVSGRCDIGVGKWERCNDVTQTVCQYPVTGLKENTMYQFRVCAVNQAGVGRPSKPTEPVLTSDPLEPSRTMGKNVRLDLNNLTNIRRHMLALLSLSQRHFTSNIKVLLA